MIMNVCRSFSYFIVWCFLLLYLCNTGVYVPSFLFVVPDGVRKVSREVGHFFTCMVPTCFCVLQFLEILHLD